MSTETRGETNYEVRDEDANSTGRQASDNADGETNAPMQTEASASNNFQSVLVEQQDNNHYAVSQNGPVSALPNPGGELSKANDGTAKQKSLTPASSLKPSPLIAIVLGAVSICCLPCAIASILLGVFAFKNAKANKNERASHLSCVGLIMGVVSLVLAILLIVGLGVGLGVGLTTCSSSYSGATSCSFHVSTGACCCQASGCSSCVFNDNCQSYIDCHNYCG